MVVLIDEAIHGLANDLAGRLVWHDRPVGLWRHALSKNVPIGRSILVGLLMGSPLLAAAGVGEGDDGVGLARETFVDASRPTKASPPFPGAPDRRLDTWIWYPAEGGGAAPVADVPARAGGPWPLVVYSHGTDGQPDNATHFIEHLVRTATSWPRRPFRSRRASPTRGCRPLT